MDIYLPNQESETAVNLSQLSKPKAVPQTNSLFLFLPGLLVTAGTSGMIPAAHSGCDGRSIQVCFFSHITLKSVEVIPGDGLDRGHKRATT